MSTNQKFRILFWLYNQKTKNEQSPLYIRIYVDQKKTEIATKHFIPKPFWDSKTGKCKSSYKHAQLLNAFIERTQHNLNQIFLGFSSMGQSVQPQDIKNKFLGIEDQPAHKTILEAFEYHNLKLSEQVKIGKVVAKTHTRYVITKNKVQAFMKKQYKVDNMPLKDMRLRFVTEFEHYLLTVDRLQSNTAHKYIKNLKKIMNMAVGMDWIPSNPFNQFKCAYSNPEREILNQDEINILINKDFHIPRLEEVRDVFIFCCYTGFAYSDVYNFRKNAVMKGLDGNFWLSTLRQKTGTKESVPLLPVALQIIQKYRDNDYCTKYDKLLPVNSNQRYNAYLKEIADLCGINKKLTSHIARHTFATTITLANGVPIETVSAMLGHNSIRTTQIYAKVVEQKVSDDMQQLRDKLTINACMPINKLG